MPVFDCEGDGLTPSKFHVLSYKSDNGIVNIHGHDNMAKWLVDQDLLIGHNIQMWDVVQLERVLGIKIKAQLIDTLALSWYLYPQRNQHGLESWGEDLGVAKPEITDWENGTQEEYDFRCSSDVEINQRLWEKQKKYLSVLYGVHPDDVVNLPIIKYLTFKLDCVVQQQRSRWKLDVDWCRASIAKLEPLREKRIQGLYEAMPQVVKWGFKNPPAKPFKKDGTLSVEGVKWQKLLRDNNLPNNHKEPVRVVVATEEPNPNSHSQVKAWLFSLGWEPATFKYEKEEDGTERSIPQLQTEDEDKNKTLCPSVLLLAEKEPAINHLAGLFVINHRLSILTGFLRDAEDGYLTANVAGLTNTLRFKHKTIVNLPGVGKPYGLDVRGCLIAREGYELCGSDMSSLGKSGACIVQEKMLKCWKP